MKKIIVAIDGYSSCGKSTTAKALASELKYTYIDSGAMYRAVTLYFLSHHISLEDPIEVNKTLEHISITFKFNSIHQKNEVYLNGINVEDEIRKMEISDRVSEVSAIAEVRHAMVALQKKMGKTKGIVMDGRDIGTTVFPDAELKIFMVADLMIRAERRQKELLYMGHAINLNDVLENLKKRDHLDTTRHESPLIQAKDSYILDNSYMTFQEQLDYVMQLAISKIVDSDSKEIFRSMSL